MTTPPHGGSGAAAQARLVRITVAILLGLSATVVGWLISSGALQITGSGKADPAPASRSPIAAPPGDQASCHALAFAAWKGFIEAADLDQRLAFVKAPERVAPLMRDFHERRGHAWPTMAKISETQTAISADFHHLIFVVEPFDGVPYAAPLEWSDGAYRVDWEVLTAYGSMDWYELLDARPAETQRMRVFLSRLKDEWKAPGLPAGAVVYVMEHRSSPDPVTVVARHAAATDLAQTVDADRVPMRVDVVWSDELDSLEIVGVAGRNWNE
jgi:hypothetical protein